MGGSTILSSRRASRSRRPAARKFSTVACRTLSAEWLQLFTPRASLRLRALFGSELNLGTCRLRASLQLRCAGDRGWRRILGAIAACRPVLDACSVLACVDVDGQTAARANRERLRVPVLRPALRPAHRQH